MTKDIDMNEIVYKLIIEDIQNVALEELDRELTHQGIPNLIDPIAENIPWYDAIARAINEVIRD